MRGARNTCRSEGNKRVYKAMRPGAPEAWVACVIKVGAKVAVFGARQAPKLDGLTVSEANNCFIIREFSGAGEGLALALTPPT